MLFDTKISISVHYRGGLRNVVSISLDPREVLFEANEKDGKQGERISFVDVAVSLRRWQSTPRSRGTLNSRSVFNQYVLRVPTRSLFSVCVVASLDSQRNRGILFQAGLKLISSLLSSHRCFQISGLDHRRGAYIIHHEQSS